MAYRAKKHNYRCCINMKNDMHKNILNVLIDFLGKPKQAGNLHPFFIVKEDKTYDGYQVRVPEEKFSSLK